MLGIGGIFIPDLPCFFSGKAKKTTPKKQRCFTFSESRESFWKEGKNSKKARISARIRKTKHKEILGSAFGRTDFRRFDFWARRIFSRILSPDFFSSFLWEKSAQKDHPWKSLIKFSTFIQQKSPTNISAEGPGQEIERSKEKKIWDFSSFCLGGFLSAKVKRGRWEGDRTKKNSRQILTIFRHVTTISDNFATCLSLCACDRIRHETSKMSRQFPTFLHQFTTNYDRMLAVPFWPSPILEACVP